MSTSFSLCSTCGVEHAHPLPAVCAICADERQYLPPDGVQRWSPLEDLAHGRHICLTEIEPGLHGLIVEPAVGIGHRPLLAQTESGNLLWDPTGFIDDSAIDQIAALGGIRWIAASHPHMFGVQTEWADAFAARILVNRRDAEWLARPGDAIELWDDVLALASGVTLHRVGGHFPGMAVAIWTAEDGHNVMLNGDAYPPTVARGWVKFQRSFPNDIPLSAAVVRRLADHAATLSFDRLYGNFDGQEIREDAAAIVQRSAQRHIDWVSGAFDSLT